MDNNGNGYLSYSEVEQFMDEHINLQTFPLKPVLMRAFIVAKTYSSARSDLSDDYVTKCEYRFMLKYIRIYYEYYMAFYKLDSNDD